MGGSGRKRKGFPQIAPINPRQRIPSIAGGLIQLVIIRNNISYLSMHLCYFVAGRATVILCSDRNRLGRYRERSEPNAHNHLGEPCSSSDGYAAHHAGVAGCRKGVGPGSLGRLRDGAQRDVSVSRAPSGRQDSSIPCRPTAVPRGIRETSMNRQVLQETFEHSDEWWKSTAMQAVEDLAATGRPRLPDCAPYESGHIRHVCIKR